MSEFGEKNRTKAVDQELGPEALKSDVGGFGERFGKKVSPEIETQEGRRVEAMPLQVQAKGGKSNLEKEERNYDEKNPSLFKEAILPAFFTYFIGPAIVGLIAIFIAGSFALPGGPIVYGIGAMFFSVLKADDIRDIIRERRHNRN